jgi:hypothetical protein
VSAATKLFDLRSAGPKLAGASPHPIERPFFVASAAGAPREVQPAAVATLALRTVRSVNQLNAE